MEIKLGIAKLVDDAIIKKASEEKSRNYMGASIIGEECDRKLWYQFKHPKPILDPRIQRIFRMGDKVEDLVVYWLKDAGLTVYDVDKNGEQFGFVDGDVAGHCDGVIIGLPGSDKPHLLEVKSAKNSSFNQYVKNGVKKQSSTYYIQMQSYMHKLGLERALFVMMNKDNQELYFERVKYDKVAAHSALLRAKEIAGSDEMPDRKYAKSTFYKCRFCDYAKECWDE